jgi:hypothetical protein
MDINVFLLCFNESALLPHAIKHYKKYLPSCKITIYDNESTDDSVKIAKDLGCSVISWNSNNCIDDFKYIEIKNNCWKNVEKGWIIMADMDEFLCVSEDDLNREYKLGTTILSVKGYDMIGESETLDLSDIDLQEIKKCVENMYESKYLCFLRDEIEEINYNMGAHRIDPIGKIIQYSSTIYINKHMSSLGLKFLTNKNITRFERGEKMREKKLAVHYLNNKKKIEKLYKKQINNSITIPNQEITY